MIRGKAFLAAKTFGDGMSAFFRGQKYVWMTHRHLLRYCILPMVLGTLAFVLLGVLFIFGIDDVLRMMWEKPTHWAWQIIWYGFATVTVVISAVTAIVLAYLLFMVICAPFNDLLSEKVEVLEGTLDSKPFSWSFFWRDAGQSVLLEMVKMRKKLVWVVILYLASLLIPVVGQALYLGLGTYKMSLWLGMDYVDWSLSRRGYAARDKFAFAAEHRTALRGFGLMMTLVSLIPLGAVLFWPGAIAGGTLLCTGLSVRDHRKEVVPARQ